MVFVLLVSALCNVYPILSVSPVCLFVIAPSVFSYVYLQFILYGKITMFRPTMQEYISTKYHLIILTFIDEKTKPLNIPILLMMLGW